QGEPFVGAAGKLLDNMLKAIGLNRQKVFIANILKCRPPSNRNPSNEEAMACEAYLLRQIDLIQPKMVLSVGGVSAKNLLKTEEAVGRLRQQKQQMVKRKLPVLVTYHPAYLLRKPSEKAKSWEDLKKLKQMMKELDCA
ncbi:MAG: uracil-DNA glycosylase, partial [Gammaproteobacteria bacterium]